MRARIPDAINRSRKRQRLKSRAACLHIAPYADVSAESSANVVRVRFLHALGQVVERSANDVRCSEETPKICMLIDAITAYPQNVAVLHIPAVRAEVSCHETRETAAHEIIIIHHHGIAAFVG